MKRYRRILAFICGVLMLASLTGVAFAEGSAPGAADIRATGDDKLIYMPAEGSFLPNSAVMYAKAGQGHSIFAYLQPEIAEDEAYMPPVFHGAKVCVLAEQNGFSCVLYRGGDSAMHAAWVVTEQLVPDYPGLVIGQQSAQGTNIGDPSVSWSKDKFPGSKQKYTVLDAAIEDCVGFTLDYQVTGRNGAWIDEVTGTRTIYVNDGTDWTEVGQFELSELEPVHVVVTLQKPITVKAVATLADCLKPDTFLFRQGLLDVYTA